MACVSFPVADEAAAGLIILLATHSFGKLQTNHKDDDGDSNPDMSSLDFNEHFKNCKKTQPHDLECGLSPCLILCSVLYFIIVWNFLIVMDGIQPSIFKPSHLKWTVGDLFFLLCSYDLFE